MKLFTLQEAEELLPTVERCLRSAIDGRNQASRLEAEMNQLLSRIHAHGGIQVDLGATMALKNGREQAMERLKQALLEIQSHGVLVKDLDIGLIDFPTLLDQDEVYLCWKLGEAHIAWWHQVSEGYQSRKAIDDDFLRRHRGGRPH